MLDDKPLKLRESTDFFVCDISHPVLKDDIASMENPIFSLSSKPDREVRYYAANGNSIKITPSGIGLATIHDKDILIYCMSQIVARMNKGEPINKKIRIKARDLLASTNRGTGGRAYKLLKDSLERLRGTSITTDIETNGKRIVEGFGLIDRWKIVTEDDKTDKMIELEITLSDWMYNSILGKEILTINKKYFELRGALERRIYELARKYCGKQKEWRINIEKLREKCGSQSNLRHFKYLLKKIQDGDELFDYHFNIEGEIVVFNSFKQEYSHKVIKDTKILLKSDTYIKARKVAPGYDIYALEQEWLSWWKTSGQPELRSPDAAFVGFCRQKYDNGLKPYGLLL
ncbi:replication initiator protein A [Aetokthonos hydrillicola Thurmond2011]|jgi:plasmid replication initiation protein|uniref:Replication initiator protein A n=1 Tax=Aetokthonos hydrillicola Thurmond2011 TaxID=2712845 RepID=A0AAP5IG24_9CYAN|nr:replication initiator protein A [Aetokthonos hydrillicola]MDR9900961.1 replication initiator protein A [Aetokthonos hydrillicola Thurmond2011]